MSRVKAPINAIPVPHQGISSQMICDMCDLMAPTQAEVLGIIKWLYRESGLSTTAVSALTGISAERLRRVKNGLKLTTVEVRSLWFLQMADVAPEMLHDLFTLGTWGKAVKRGSQGGKFGFKRPEYGKGSDRYLLDPTRIWMNVDWRLRNGQIARRYEYSRWQVKNMRLRLAKIPKHDLLSHIIDTRRDPDYFAPFLSWEVPVQQNGQLGWLVKPDDYDDSWRHKDDSQ